MINMDIIEVELKDGRRYRGREMPVTEYNKEGVIIIKLKSGYNLSLKKDEVKSIKTIKKEKKVEKERGEDGKEGELMILSAGGTIASKVEYETGGVVASYSAEDIIKKVPEIKKMFKSIGSRFVFNEMSENMHPWHWEVMIKEVRKLRDVNGVIITHGTDTMHYSSAALSFALSDIDFPVVLVGAQRSSDRPSSDAFMNLLAAGAFIKEMNRRGEGGVFIVMHSSLNDTDFNTIRGVRARKMHTSRRDAFKSVNEESFAIIKYDLRNHEFNVDIKGSVKKRESLGSAFSREVGLIKVFPGMKAEIFEDMIRRYKGVVVEGTGLGHVSNSEDKEYNLLDVVKKYSKGKVIVITSQTIYGATHPYVYKNLRLLSKAGAIYVEDMLPEVAYVKLSYLFGNEKDMERIRELMKENFVGEMKERRRVGE